MNVDYKGGCARLALYRKKLGNRFAVGGDSPQEWPIAIEWCPQEPDSLRVVFREVPTDPARVEWFRSAPELGPTPMNLVAGHFPRLLSGDGSTVGKGGTRVPAGERARNEKTNAKGTAGWYVYFLEDLKRLVCLGNRHVFGGPGTFIKLRRLDGRYGKVVFSYPLDYCNGNHCPMNRWDLALAHVSPQDVRAEMDPPSGSPISYPYEISNIIDTEDTYQCVGYGHSGTSEGKFDCIWEGSVPYGSETACFTGVLRFDLKTKPGDSGALIIRKEGPSATGIAFARDGKKTFANPLAELGWTYVRTDGEFPVFRP